MNIIFSGIFWGALLIVLGILIIIKILFHVDIPVFRILIALFFIWLGVKIIADGFSFGKNADEDKSNIVFSETNVNAGTGDNEYNIVFGKGVIDLHQIALSDIKGDYVTIKVNSVFSGGVVKLNPEIPTVVRAESAFGGIQMPDGNSTAFGRYTYRTKNYRDGAKYIYVKANVVFGGLQIIE